MEHLGVLVKVPADAVAAVFPHDGAVVGLGVLLNRVADVPETHAWLDHLDSNAHGLVSHADHPLGQDRGLSDEHHLAGIAVEAVFDHGNVDVDDVPVLELLVPRDAVADLMVDRGADGFGETVVVERRRHRLLHVDDVVVADIVELARGHARFHVRSDHVQHVGGELSRDAHLFDLVRRLDGVAHRSGVVGRETRR